MRNAVITVIFVLCSIVGIVYFIQRTEQADNTAELKKNNTQTTQKQSPSQVQNTDASSPETITPTEDQSMNNQTNPTTNPTKFSKPEMLIDKNKSYEAVVSTDKGEFTIKFTTETPITVNNFIYLAKKHFYDNTIFHRVIKGFMIQGGDPTGTGAGGPGYRFDDEKFSGSYKRGVVAMANAGPNTNGSQFFIMHQDYNLPPNYVIFGEVVSGMDVIDAIATSPVQESAQGELSQPVSPVHIQSIQIKEQ